MQHAREYVDNGEQKIETLRLLNHVRMFKKVCLPCELLGQRGKEQTVACRENAKKSQIKWTFYHHEVNTPSRKAFRKWKGFIKWLQSRNIDAIFDFDEDATWTWKLRVDQRVLIINENNEKKKHAKMINNEHSEIEWKP